MDIKEIELVTVDWIHLVLESGRLLQTVADHFDTVVH